MNILKKLLLAIGFIVIYLFILELYIFGICKPLSNGSDILFVTLLICGFIFIDIAIRIDERFKLFDKISITPKYYKTFLIIFSLIIAYNLLFRYEYKIIKGKYYNEIVKIDKLTGISTVSTPKFVENKK